MILARKSSIRSKQDNRRSGTSSGLTVTLTDSVYINLRGGLRKNLQRCRSVWEETPRIPVTCHSARQENNVHGLEIKVSGAASGDGIPSRRSVLACFLATASQGFNGISAEAGPSRDELSNLLEDGQPFYNPGVSWVPGNYGKQQLYPEWMKGDFQVQATFQNVSFPQGQRLVNKTTPGVTKASLIAAMADVGAAMEGPLQYRARYVSSPQEGGIVADRPYNIQQCVDAFLGYAAVKLVEYEPIRNPTRLAVSYTTPRKDIRAITEDNRKAEIFINNRSHETSADGNVFTGIETFRQVTQASQQGGVGDYSVLGRYSLQPDGSVVVKQRVAAFLQPQDALFFESKNQAVALYDYSFVLSRI